jgi:hypothetical protein
MILFNATFIARHRTRSSIFAIRTKPTCKPIIAKELALPAPRLDTFCHFETFDNKTIKKRTQLLTTAHSQCGFQKVFKRQRPHVGICASGQGRNHAIPHWQ